jgi:peptide deformylase
MAIRPILKMGDPRLLEPSLPVTEFGTTSLKILVDDMFDTMRAYNGAGLAAPQIAEPLQVVIFGFEKNQRYPDAPPVPETVLINPEIIALDEETENGWEGCLSVPGLRGEVPRFRTIRYTGYTMDGDRIDRVAEGFHARVVQHECDHLQGILYPTKINDLKRFGFTDTLPALR